MSLVPRTEPTPWDAIKAYQSRLDAIVRLFAQHRAQRRAWVRRYLGDWNA